ncbi:MAG: heavy metal translocating P-type ATPase [Candidatus Bathyarchaeia archaeon]
MAKDPVCGMYVNENKEGVIKREVRGRTYYFCSESCAETFIRPEVELRNLRRLVIFSWGLGAITLIFTHVRILPVLPNEAWLFIFATPVQFIAGYRYYRGAYDALRSRNANMDTLIAVGTSAAWVYSTVTTFIPGFFSMREVYFDTSTLIITLVLTGRLLEEEAKGKASDAIRKLMDLQPEIAWLLRDGEEVKIPVEHVKPGDILVVKSGDKIPADGVVIEGYSFVDEKMITGESMPVEKEVGSEVVGGTTNISGVMKIKATKVGADATLSQIIRLVEDTYMSRAPLQRLADMVSSYFVPVVILIACFAFFAWHLVGVMSFSFSLIVAIAVLVIACPCALGIAAPMAVMIGAEKGAENGILIKGGEYLEKAHKLQTIIFDKTGTLTRGEPSLTNIITFSELGDDEILRFAAIAEKNSEHPLGEAIVRSARGRGIGIPDPSKFEVAPGCGVKAGYDGKLILLGNRRLMEDNGIAIEGLEDKIVSIEEEGKTVMILALDGVMVGAVAVADTLKEHAKEVVDALQGMGVEIVMFTGDNYRTANAIAEKLGIKYVLAGMLPKDKADEVKHLQEEGRVVGFVGDGINDAPALAQADVGIAIGSGTDVAKETGGIILIKDDLRDILTAIRLSRKTFRKIKENLFWAFAYNTALIPVAAGALYPSFQILLHPILAAAAMGFSSLTVVGNSLLLKRFKP